MRRRTWLLAMLWLAVAGAGWVRGHGPSKKLFLLEDAANHQWCAYRDQSAWKIDVNSTTALNVSSIEFVGEKASVVNLTHEDETWDWILYDQLYCRARRRNETAQKNDKSSSWRNKRRRVVLD